MRLIHVLAFLLAFCFTQGQQRKYSVANAHSHNDYLQKQPFSLAYGQRFGSIEADIMLFNGRLLVGHDPRHPDPTRLLEELYLQPLQQVVRRAGGYVYPDKSRQLILLIDLKTGADSTLPALVQLLSAYKDLTGCPTLKFVITGNQPPASALPSFPSWIYFDGHLDINYSPEALQKIELFSDNFRNYSQWKGEGKLDEVERNRLDSAVARAHRFQKPVRFWAAPDTEAAWKQLQTQNVDYINTDRIEELGRFLNQ